MSTSATPITATVPNKLIGDHRSDLLLVGLLKSAGIPAVSVNPGWKFGITTSAPGTVTSVQGKTDTVFTWVPTPVPPTAQETQIAALQATATSASETIAKMTAELATANETIASLTKQLATVTAHDTAMIAELAAANVQVTSLTKQITAAESTLKPAPATPNAGGATAPAATTGATGTTAPASTPAA